MNRKRKQRERAPRRHARDDHRAKYLIWAQDGDVSSLPRPVGLPRFASQRFDSYSAFNAWKRSYILQIARAGGCQWKR